MSKITTLIVTILFGVAAFAIGSQFARAEEATPEANQAEQKRDVASQQVFTQDYLETIKDEAAAEQMKQQQLEEEHKKYLKHLDRRRN